MQGEVRGDPDPQSDLRGFLRSLLSIANPSPTSTKMHFSEPKISLSPLPLPSTPSIYFTFSGKPWDSPYQKIQYPPLYITYRSGVVTQSLVSL